MNDQSAPDKASCKWRYPALTCNELLGGSLMKPRSVIFYHSMCWAIPRDATRLSASLEGGPKLQL